MNRKSSLLMLLAMTAACGAFAQPPTQSPQTSPAEAPVALDPGVERALIGVMGMEDLVLQTEQLCLQALPTSFKKYTAATASWKERNAALLAKQRRVLAEAFGPTQRKLVEGALKVKNQRMLAPILSASMAAKIKWCDQSIDEINAGAMDVHDKQNLSAPLMNYRLKS